VTAQLDVELVLATRERQVLRTLQVEEGATVADVISRSGIAAEFPGLNIDKLEVGVWGRLVDRDHVVTGGDRVEIYRQLAIDPREARRQLADVGRTMGKPADN
jgi:putative ubiquitin-RnfH superfamily antitoxin RatB of RatAB toxin-antitoxin module